MIRIVNKSSFTDGASGNITLSNFPVFGGNPLLVVCAAARAGSAPTSVKWNGVDFTKAIDITDNTTYTENASIWYLVPPYPGTYNIVVAGNGTLNTFYAYLLNDVAQSSPADGTGTDNGHAQGAENPSITTGTNGSMVIQLNACIVANTGAAQLNGTNLTSGQTIVSEDYGGPSTHALSIDFKIIATAGTNSLAAQMQYNGSNVSIEDNCSCLCGFKESISPNQGSAFLLTQF